MITQRGAHLRTFHILDRDIVVPFSADQMPSASSGAVLIPWPNRLRDGTYEFDGATHHVAITEPDRGTALHGLAYDKDWAVTDHSESAITLELVLENIPGYPFRLTTQITYELVSQTELRITTTAVNEGNSAAPYGVGFHPWLSPGAGGLDSASFELKVDSWMRTDERLLPINWEPVPSGLDYRELRNLADSDLDDAFSHPATQADGSSSARLVCSDGVEIVVWADHTLPYWQVCTGNHVAPLRRVGIAVEPMSCVADAFRTGEALITLEPEQSHTSTWAITAQGIGN